MDSMEKFNETKLPSQSHLYNKIKPLYVNTHTDEEIFSMVMSELEE